MPTPIGRVPRLACPAVQSYPTGSKLPVAHESGQERGLRSRSQLWLSFVRHPRVPLLKPTAQLLVEDLGPIL